LNGIPRIEDEGSKNRLRLEDDFWISPASKGGSHTTHCWSFVCFYYTAGISHPASPSLSLSTSFFFIDLHFVVRIFTDTWRVWGDL
jgi:hypothetical protein